MLAQSINNPKEKSSSHAIPSAEQVGWVDGILGEVVEEEAIVGSLAITVDVPSTTLRPPY